MDTILQPRNLSNTESDSSEEDRDRERKDSSSSSKVTVVPKEGVDQPKQLEATQVASGSVPTDEDGKQIFCPTARFLQVNPKKLSSYDLLVRPPKRARFIVHPSREDMSWGAGRGTIFKQKTIPLAVPGGRSKSKIPTVECVYFENEKLKYRKTSSGSWSSSSSSASPRAPNSERKGSSNEKSIPKFSRIPVPLPRIFSEEHTISQIETEEEMMRSTEGAPVESNRTDFEVKEFPATKNFAFYAHWSPSFQLIYQEYEKERLKDVNKNYLPSKPSTMFAIPNESQKSNAASTELPKRKILKPVYRLTNINPTSEAGGQPLRPSTVFLKESDYNSEIELRLFHKDEKSRNKPPQKKRKFNGPGEYEEEEVVRSERIRGCKYEVPYKPDASKVTQESNVVNGGDSAAVEERHESIQQKHVSSIFRTTFQDHSSAHYGMPINIQANEEISVIHHPDLRDFCTTSSTMGRMTVTMDENANNLSRSEGKLENVEEKDATEEPMSSFKPMYTPSLTEIHDCSNFADTPFQIFLSDSSILTGPSSGFHYGVEHPFLNFPNNNDGIGESHIVDVTDLSDDEDTAIEITTQRSENCGDSKEMHTILKARTTGTSSPYIQHGLSESCHFVEELLRRNNRQDQGEETLSSDRPPREETFDMEDFDSQEVLMQPKPQLNISTSVHSAVERGVVHATTLDNFVQKQTKSDYFVGKIPGISKSGTNLHRRYSTILIDQFAEKNDHSAEHDVVALNLVEELNCATPLVTDAPLSGKNDGKESQRFGKNIENVFRRFSSGNKVKDNGDNASTPEAKEMKSLRTAVPLSEKTSTSSFCELDSYKGKNSNPLVQDEQKSSLPNSSGVKPRPILKKEKKPSVIKRMIRSLCKNFSKAKQKPSDANNLMDDWYNGHRSALPAVPSYLLRQRRRIVQHTDSKELYKERRQRFFKEQKEFYDESLATYVKSALLLEQRDRSKAGTDNESVPTCIPITSFRDKSIMFNRDSVQDACNNNYWRNDKDDDDCVHIPVRLATSESALTGPACKRQGKSSLVLQFPPFVQVLAVALARRRSLQDNFSELQKDKETLKKPLKGILKKR